MGQIFKPSTKAQKNIRKKMVKRIQEWEDEEMYDVMISSGHGVTIVLVVSFISCNYVPRLYGKDGCSTLVPLHSML